MKKKFKGLIENEYIYSVIARVIGVVLGLVYSILYSRYLGTELRGEASVVTNFASLSSLALCMGIYQAYPFFRKKQEQDIRELYIAFINKTLGLCLVYAVICGCIALFLPLSSGRKIAFILMPFMVGIKLLNYVVLIEHPKIRNTASIYLFLIDIAVIVGLMIFTTANLIFCYGFLIVKEMLYFIIAFHNAGIAFSELHPTMRGLLPYIRYGWIPMITVILMEVNYKVDVLMLEGQVSPGDIGIYSLGIQLAERLWLIPDALKDILLSKLTKGQGADEVARVTRISLVTMLICIAMAIIFGRLFIVLLFGEEYRDAYEIMLVILVSVISMVFYKMIYSYNVANGRRVVNMTILAVAAVANVGINLVLIPIMGTMGAAVASLISYSVCGITFLVYFVVTTHIPIHKMLFVTKKDMKAIMSAVGKKF